MNDRQKPQNFQNKLNTQQRCVNFVNHLDSIRVLAILCPVKSKVLCALASFVVPAWLLAAPGSCCPPPPSVSLGFRCFRFVLRFFFFSLCATVVFGFLWFPVPGALGLGAVCCLFCWPPASRLSVRWRLFCVSRLTVGCSLVVAAPPPRVVSLGLRRCRSVLHFFFLFFSSPCAPPLSLAFFRFRPRVPWAPALFAVCFVALPPLCVSRPAVGCSLVVAPPPPTFVSLGLRCCCLVIWFSLFSSAVLAACSPPPPGACLVPCAVWSCRAALPFCVACRAVVAPLAALWAAARCAVFAGVCVCVLCCAVGCCCVLCPVSGHAVRFGCSLCGLLPGFGLRCRVQCCAVCLWVRCCAALLRVVPPGVVLLCAVLFCCACLVSLLVVPCPLALAVALGPCALRRCVLRCSSALSALSCVCSVVACWCVLLFAAVMCAVCVLWRRAVHSLSPPLCAVLCSVLLVRLRRAVRVVRAVAGTWCCGALLCVVLFPMVFSGAVLGLAARGCLLVVCFGVGVPV